MYRRPNYRAKAARNMGHARAFAITARLCLERFDPTSAAHYDEAVKDYASRAFHCARVALLVEASDLALNPDPRD